MSILIYTLSRIGFFMTLIYLLSRVYFWIREEIEEMNRRNAELDQLHDDSLERIQIEQFESIQANITNCQENGAS